MAKSKVIMSLVNTKCILSLITFYFFILTDIADSPSSGADYWGFLTGSIAFIALCVIASAIIIIRARQGHTSGYIPLAMEEQR